ncbi:MAG TPA: hypothetical protein VLY04_24700 [Bryobacteraceae bacterium]|nr:hypothetical protein [Bryobacteraceae bacterium]
MRKAVDSGGLDEVETARQAALEGRGRLLGRMLRGLEGQIDLLQMGLVDDPADADRLANRLSKILSENRKRNPPG